MDVYSVEPAIICLGWLGTIVNSVLLGDSWRLLRNTAAQRNRGNEYKTQTATRCNLFRISAEYAKFITFAARSALSDSRSHSAAFRRRTGVVVKKPSRACILPRRSCMYRY